jgi:hypothetical protein
MCTQYLHLVHLPMPFPTSTSLPLVDLLYPPVLQFCKRKINDIFICLRYTIFFKVFPGETFERELVPRLVS